MKVFCFNIYILCETVSRYLKLNRQNEKAQLFDIFKYICGINLYSHVVQ